MKIKKVLQVLAIIVGTAIGFIGGIFTGMKYLQTKVLEDLY